MTCKRCGCTDAIPCAIGCAWSLPDVCSRCLTADEARLERQYASLIDDLRAELEQDRFERYLLAVTQGLLAGDPASGHHTEKFVEQAFHLALALSEAAPEVDEADDDGAQPATRLVVP